VPANIAEGFVKRGKPDKARLMNVAQGSLEEARYYLILADDLGYGKMVCCWQTPKKYLACWNATLSAYASVSLFWLLASGFWLPVLNK
jgi:23S rRNA-intervening sequence protein